MVRHPTEIATRGMVLVEDLIVEVVGVGLQTAGSLAYPAERLYLLASTAWTPFHKP